MTEKDAFFSNAKKLEEKSRKKEENKWNNNKDKSSIHSSKMFTR
jgi:hypothetical protein